MPDDIKWIRSYVLEEGGGSVGTVCIYQASSPEAIRKHAKLADLPVDEIIAVTNTLGVRGDPGVARGNWHGFHRVHPRDPALRSLPRTAPSRRSPRGCGSGRLRGRLGVFASADASVVRRRDERGPGRIPRPRRCASSGRTRRRASRFTWRRRVASSFGMSARAWLRSVTVSDCAPARSARSAASSR